MNYGEDDSVPIAADPTEWADDAASPGWALTQRGPVNASPIYPAVPDSGWWAGREVARTPVWPRTRIIAQFRSAENLAYLRAMMARLTPRGPLRDFALATLDEAALTFSAGSGRALDLLQSDELAVRGAQRVGLDHWAEVRRLNRAFVEDRMSFLREKAGFIENRAPRDGIAEDDEPYHMRMFVADSLRPPGLEHLNTPGPLYAVREKQSTWVPKAAGRPPSAPATRAMSRAPPAQPRAPPPSGRPSAPRSPPQGKQSAQGAARKSEGFTGAKPRPAARGAGGASAPKMPRTVADYAVLAGVDVDGILNEDDDIDPSPTSDAPWGMGNPNRTPEQAMAEFMGDGWVSSETMIGAPETAGQSYGSMYAWGKNWRDNGGTRFERYPSIPFWQKGGREGIEYDIEETLGTAARETDNPILGWNMSKLTNPRGQEYRRYGARSSHVV